MTNKRDEFSKDVVRTLQERVGNRCSNLGCGRPTSVPNHAPDKATRIGVAAHITAAAAGGPRFDPHLTAEQRAAIQNGIWLCQNCSKLVDSDVRRYSIETLLKWKSAAEARALEEIKGIQEPYTPPTQNYEGWECQFCGTLVPDKRTVCLGCQAEVVYGATSLECQNAATTGAFFGGIAAMLSNIRTTKLVSHDFLLQHHSRLGTWFLFDYPSRCSSHPKRDVFHLSRIGLTQKKLRNIFDLISCLGKIDIPFMRETPCEANSS